MNDLGNSNVFVKNLERYMLEEGISRKELCEKLEIKYSTLNNWVQGVAYPRIDKIEKIANYFGITKSELVEDQSNISELDRYLGMLSNLYDNETTLKLIKNYILMDKEQKEVLATLAEQMAK